MKYYSIIGLFAFTLITPPLGIAQQDPDNIDVRLFRSINNNRSQFLTGTANILDYSVYPVSIGLPLGLVGYGLVNNARYEEDSGYLLAITELLSIATYVSLKQVFKRPRPYMKLAEVHVGHLKTTSRYSFPSGHSSLATSIATIFSLRYPTPWVYVPAFTWAALAGYSRIYYGLHYPSDVLAGTAIGVAAGIFVHHFEEALVAWKQAIIGQNVSVFFAQDEEGVKVRIGFRM